MSRYISRAVALFIALMFIIIASFSACTYSFQKLLLDVDTYKQTLVDQKMYNDIIPYVIPGLLEDYQTRLTPDDNIMIDLNDIDSFMSVNDWRNVSNELVPPEWLQTQTESALDAVNRIKQGDFSQLDNIVDLSEVVARLKGDAGQRASQIIIEAAPDCTTQQIAQLRQLNTDRGTVFPICQPPSIQQNTSAEVISGWFVNLGIIIERVENERHTTQIPEEVASLLYYLFQLDTQLSFLLLLCPLSLIGLIMIFAIRNLKSFSRWFGWTFISSGIMTLMLIFASQASVFSSFDDVVQASSDIERFEAQIFAGFSRSVYVDASSTMLMIAGGLIAIGFVLLVISLREQSSNLVLADGSVVIIEDGRIVSATQPQQQTVVLPKNKKS